MSDQTPIETLTERIEKARAYMNGWLADEPDGSPEKAKVGRYVADLLNELDAHVEAQRPGKVLTDDEVGRIAWKCYPHIRAQDAGRNADMATKRSAGIELLRYARDNGYLAPAQPLSAQQVFDVVEEFIKQEAERVGTDQPTGLEYPVGHRHWNNMIADLRERLNKLIG
jgi:hypothetical protein